MPLRLEAPLSPQEARKANKYGRSEHDNYATDRSGEACRLLAPPDPTGSTGGLGGERRDGWGIHPNRCAHADTDRRTAWLGGCARFWPDMGGLRAVAACAGLHRAGGTGARVSLTSMADKATI